MIHLPLIKKLRVLSKIAKILNDSKVVWALGGSFMLFLRGVTKNFDDIDIVVRFVSDADRKNVVKKICSFGVLQPKRFDPQFCSKHFFEFSIDKVDIDVIEDLAIKKQGVVYSYRLDKSSIDSSTYIYDQVIPLHSILQWRRYYDLMDRTEKVRMINLWMVKICFCTKFALKFLK